MGPGFCLRALGLETGLSSLGTDYSLFAQLCSPNQSPRDTLRSREMGRFPFYVYFIFIFLRIPIGILKGQTG